MQQLNRIDLNHIPGHIRVTSPTFLPGRIKEKGSGVATGKQTPKVKVWLLVEKDPEPEEKHPCKHFNNKDYWFLGAYTRNQVVEKYHVPKGTINYNILKGYTNKGGFYFEKIVTAVK